MDFPKCLLICSLHIVTCTALDTDQCPSTQHIQLADSSWLFQRRGHFLTFVWKYLPTCAFSLLRTELLF